jgi:hypothetical protein
VPVSDAENAIAIVTVPFDGVMFDGAAVITPEPVYAEIKTKEVETTELLTSVSV